MDITVPQTLQLPARSTTNRLLEASTDKLGVHNVRISVTDVEGNPLGSTDQLPIRAAQVSQVIWLIMGVAAGLLFIAIVLRVVRRIRGTRADDDTEPPADAPTGESTRAPEPAAPAR
jgi:hypothetical protein